MPKYHIVPEFYVTKEVLYDNKRCPPIEFMYAIRREDESLVYRTETHEFASEILSNLEYPKARLVAA